MQFTVKNLKISKFASEETLCFEATVYMDGVKSFIASNHGCGGCNNYHDLGNGALKRAEAWVAEQPDVTCESMRDPLDKTKPFTYKPDLDHYIDEAIQAVEIEREVKKSLKNVCGTVDGKIYEWKIPASHPKGRDVVREKNPTVIFLNDLPLAEAVAIYKAQALGGSYAG